MILPPAACATLARLRPEDAAALAPCLLPAVRVQLRNALIRVALSRLYGGLPKTPAARALAEELHAGAAGGTPKADMLVAIIALNGNRPLSWRWIVNITDAGNGKCTKSRFSAFL
jgi:hypothetical protein